MAVDITKKRKLKKKRKQCLWCTKKRAKNSSLCRSCKLKHKDARRKSYERKRTPMSTQYRCTKCGQLGHNARRHRKR